VHIIQEKLLRLSKEQNLGKLKLREIGRLISEPSPQKVKHHLLQLEKKGLIRVDRSKSLIQRTEPGWVKGFAKKARLLSIPILGSANCGSAELFAEQNIEGYLRVSDTLLERRKSTGLFALRAQGLSMNRAIIGGKYVEDGDYLIINSNDLNPKNGDIVVSVIDGTANIKKFVRDEENQQIALLSESTREFSPIYIHEGDDYFVNGKVVQIIKKPKLLKQKG